MATTWEAKASSSSPADGLSTPDIFKTEFAHLVCEHLAVALQNCALGCVVNSKRDDAGTAAMAYRMRPGDLYETQSIGGQVRSAVGEKACVLCRRCSARSRCLIDRVQHASTPVPAAHLHTSPASCGLFSQHFSSTHLLLLRATCAPIRSLSSGQRPPTQATRSPPSPDLWHIVTPPRRSCCLQ